MKRERTRKTEAEQRPRASFRPQLLNVRMLLREKEREKEKKKRQVQTGKNECAWSVLSRGPTSQASERDYPLIS